MDDEWIIGSRLERWLEVRTPWAYVTRLKREPDLLKGHPLGLIQVRRYEVVTGMETNCVWVEDRQTIETPYQEKSLLRSQLKVLDVNDVVQLSIPTLVRSIIIFRKGRFLLRSLVDRFPSSTGRDRDRTWNHFPCPKGLLSLCCGCHDGIGSVHLEPLPLLSTLCCDLLGSHCKIRQAKPAISRQKSQYLSPRVRLYGH